MTRSRPPLAIRGLPRAGTLAVAVTLAAAIAGGAPLEAQSPAPSSSTATAPPSDLFRALPGAVDPMLARDRGIVRSRPVAIDVDLLRRIEPAARTRVRFELFPDAVYTGVFERVERRSADDFTWYGSLAGIPDSGFILTVFHDAVAGGFTSPDGSVNSIAVQSAPGMQLIRQWDPAAFRCGADATVTPAGTLHGHGHPEGVCDDDGTLLRILVAFTPQAEAEAGGYTKVIAQCQYGIDSMNNALARSGIGMRAMATRFHRTFYNTCSAGNGMLGDLQALTGESDGYMEEVHYLRDEDHADTVVLIVDNAACHGSTAGIAWTMTNLGPSFEQSAFSVVEWTSMFPAFAHEVGHNLGCGHDPATGGNKLYPYSQGHQWFTISTSGSTVMAYADLLHPYQPYFSNPAIRHNGEPTGSGSSNNAWTIQQTRTTACNWRTDRSLPILYRGPKDATICAGTNHGVMNVLAGNQPSYQWRRNGVPVPGQTGSTLDFSNATPADSGIWDCVISNSCGAVTSNAARLTVNDCSTLYVDASRPFPGGDGRSWQQAHTELFTALDRAIALGTVREIRVAQGTYSASRRGPILQREFSHVLPDDVTVLGGYPTGGGASRDPAAYPTIVDGELQPGWFALHVFQSFGAVNAVLDGLVIRNGRADVPNALDKAFGGGLLVDGGSIELRDCTLTGNRALEGGAFYVTRGATLRLSHCRIEDNLTDGLGGGVFVRSSAFEAVNTTFTRNQSLQGGGAVHNDSSSVLLVNCTFDRNAGSRGALHAAFGDTNAVNCTVVGNIGSNGPGGFSIPNGTFNVVNSILWGNAGTLPTLEANQFLGGGRGGVTFCCVQGLAGLTGAGNIGLDPGFVQSTSADFHLRADSPCIDAGTTTAPLAATDFEGDPRIDPSGRVDIGVDENTGGRVRPFGSGCAGGIAFTGAPEIGSKMTILGWSPYSAGTLFAGFGKANWAGFELPLELTPLGSPNCFLNVSPDIDVWTGALGTTGAQANGPEIPIPDVPALIGGTLYFQWHFWKHIVSPYLTSGALEVTLGS